MKRLVLVLALVATVALLGWHLLGKGRSSPNGDLVILEPTAPPAQGETKKPIDVKAVRAKIESAVKAGKLTKEQADAKLKWLEAQGK
jgi:hypothetical protein